MAGAGSLPKEQRSRSRDNAKREAVTDKVTADGVLRGPDLPSGGEDFWPERTREWWETLRRSPMAKTWIAADWDTLIDTALLHRRLWAEGDTSVMSELRLRMSQFGTNPESRLRLRISVEQEAEEAAKPVPAVATDRRRRLLKAVE